MVVLYVKIVTYSIIIQDITLKLGKIRIIINRFPISTMNTIVE